MPGGGGRCWWTDSGARQLPRERPLSETFVDVKSLDFLLFFFLMTHPAPFALTEPSEPKHDLFGTLNKWFSA